jgi:hypothetical protein
MRAYRGNITENYLKNNQNKSPRQARAVCDWQLFYIHRKRRITAIPTKKNRESTRATFIAPLLNLRICILFLLYRI